MARRFNISGELTQVLLAAGTNENVKKISLTNVQKVSKCKVDLYIEKALTGKFYLLKGVVYFNWLYRSSGKRDGSWCKYIVFKRGIYRG